MRRGTWDLKQTLKWALFWLIIIPMENNKTFSLKKVIPLISWVFWWRRGFEWLSHLGFKREQCDYCFWNILWIDIRFHHRRWIRKTNKLFNWKKEWREQRFCIWPYWNRIERVFSDKDHSIERLKTLKQGQ